MDQSANYSGRSTERESRARDQGGQGGQGDELELREAWGDASHAVERLYTHASSLVQQTVQEKPYVALAAAAGLGFVLGGGLGSTTGRLLLRTTAQLLIPAALTTLRGLEEK